MVSNNELGLSMDTMSLIWGMLMCVGEYFIIKHNFLIIKITEESTFVDFIVANMFLAMITGLMSSIIATIIYGLSVNEIMSVIIAVLIIFIMVYLLWRVYKIVNKK